MSNIETLEFCELWIDAIKPFSDLEYQKRVWFRHEGEEVDSYEDAIESLLEIAERNLVPKYQNCLNVESYSLVQEFVSKIDHYRHSPLYINGKSEERLHGDPNWKRIVLLAQDTHRALNAFKMEIGHA